MSKFAEGPRYWAHVPLDQVPCMTVPAPGPKSKEMHARTCKYFKGLSGQVKLFPVAFASGKGCELVDVDGNRYLDFSSGIYVTTLGHCHPKVTEAVQKAAGQLMNAHDFTTPVKTKLVEKLAEVLPGDLTGFQFYDSGTTAVEAGQPQGVHSAGLQLLDQALVDLAAIDHLEHFESGAVGVAAGMPAGASNEPRRQA